MFANARTSQYQIRMHDLLFSIIFLTKCIIDAVHPNSEWTEEGQLWVQYVSSTPATRLDVISLQEQLDQKLQQRQARETGICPIREELYAQCFGTLHRKRFTPCGAVIHVCGMLRCVGSPCKLLMPHRWADPTDHHQLWWTWSASSTSARRHSYDYCRISDLVREQHCFWHEESTYGGTAKTKHGGQGTYHVFHSEIDAYLCSRECVCDVLLLLAIWSGRWLYCWILLMVGDGGKSENICF